MKLIGRSITVFLITVLAQSHAAATNLDVLLVFSNDSGLSAAEKAAVAASYQANLGIVFGDPITGVSGQLDIDTTVEVWPLLTEVPYTAGNKSGAQALQWMVDQNANPLSVLSVARESLGNPGADIIVMAVPGTTDSGCGGAPPIPRTTSTAHSETNAFAFVVLESSNPSCLAEYVQPHEVGHLLYAEHETDENGDDLLPSYMNHATTNASGTLRTLMWSSVSATKSTEYLSGNLGSMTSAFADNVEFMSSRSFNVVAAYRAPPPPACEIAVSQQCDGNSPRIIITPILSGYTMTNIDLDYRLSGSSNWYPIYDGAPTCPIYNPPSTFMSSIVSAVVTTAAGYVTGCTVQVTPMWCGRGDPL